MSTQKNKLLFFVILAFFSTLTAFSIIYIVSRTASASGATDFHSYWYAGHFIRQRVDPYTAYVEQISPRLPIVYLDGQIVTELPIAQPGLARVPANTPLMVELLSVFAFFSWPTAKFLWMFCNLAIALIIPFLTIRLFPQLRLSPIKNTILLTLIFFSLFGTRNAIGNGQTSIFVFAMMLMAVSTNNIWLSSIALGIALSKYSLSLPAAILLLLEKKYRVQSHLAQPGIHIAATFPPTIGWSLIFLVSTLVAIALCKYFVRAKLNPYFLSRPLLRPILFNILTLWILLTTYHRAYDTLVALVFIALLIELLLNPNNLPKIHRTVLSVALLGILAALILPKTVESIAPGINAELTSAWQRWHNPFVTLSLLVALLTSIWALYHPKIERIKDENS
ncbi:MAG: DUF2029 domain-containing protein [Thermoflexales bacterium]|nr:DUF2029 domain-containing protein [Thermoflexales bacterium]